VTCCSSKEAKARLSVILLIIISFKTEVTYDFPIREIISHPIYAEQEKLTEKLEPLWFKYKG